MGAAEIGVYAFLLNTIYDHDGPIPANDRAYRIYAHKMQMRVDHFQRDLQSLVDLHKIVIADGVMSNKRADMEITERSARVEKLSKNLRGGGAKNDREASEARLKNDREVSEGRLKDVSKKAVAQKTSNEINGHTSELGTYNNNNSNKNRDRQIPLRQRNARIDPRRKLGDQNVVFARSRGLTRREIDHEWMAFVRYYAGLNDQAKNSRSPDWDVVWESWCLRKAAELNREPLTEADAPRPLPENYDREVWMRSVEIYRATGTWHPDLVPPPDKPGYRGPPDLVRPS